MEWDLSSYDDKLMSVSYPMDFFTDFFMRISAVKLPEPKNGCCNFLFYLCAGNKSKNKNDDDKYWNAITNIIKGENAKL